MSLEIVISQHQKDEKRIIIVANWDNCQDCPYVTKTCNSHEFICNHPVRIAKKPYCNQRLVNPHIIDSDCVLLPQPEQINTIYTKCLALNGDCISCGGCSL